MSFTLQLPKSGYSIDFVNRTIVDALGLPVANLPSYDSPEKEAKDEWSFEFEALHKILFKGWRVLIWRENFSADDDRWYEVFGGTIDRDTMELHVPGINPQESFGLVVASPYLWQLQYEGMHCVSTMTEEEVEAERVRLRRVGLLEDKAE